MELEREKFNRMLMRMIKVEKENVKNKQYKNREMIEILKGIIEEEVNREN